MRDYLLEERFPGAVAFMKRWDSRVLTFGFCLWPIFLVGDGVHLVLVKWSQPKQNYCTILN